ncbi:hypothetical protein BH24PSE2_BH24PSE2_18490 [soil metagenome]
MWDLIIPSRQFTPADSDKAQAAILNLEAPTIQPNEAVPIGMGYARLFKAKPADEHRLSP